MTVKLSTISKKHSAMRAALPLTGQVTWEVFKFIAAAVLTALLEMYVCVSGEKGGTLGVAYATTQRGLCKPYQEMRGRWEASGQAESTVVRTTSASLSTRSASAEVGRYSTSKRKAGVGLPAAWRALTKGMATESQRGAPVGMLESDDCVNKRSTVMPYLRGTASVWREIVMCDV